MPRKARLVVPGVPHHVTQRGNRRQRTFFSPADYRLYLSIAAEAFADAGVEAWAYCLMPNHVHLVVVPRCPEGLAEAVGSTHRRYTRCINGREGWTGFLWHGRFASSPMEEKHLRDCVRYVGLNPVRAGLVTDALAWPWSSVAAHVEGRADPLINPAPMRERLGPGAAAFFRNAVEEGTGTRTDFPPGIRNMSPARESAPPYPNIPVWPMA